MSDWIYVLIGRLPSGITLLCTLFALLVPLSVSWVNKQLHKYGDPPWKQEE